ncbi:MAG: type I DNA topoisomerase [Candidatus Pacebacteria bacterium]|nr:type I DNA topoisomerase [Candidatus Paceibacterota bacterium]MDD4994695.1 type I DNA topoisomerase [Candidatus Paceibacterota bacterium]MDD5535384.1 type I DNA topoisomerase [Candidatus Paceibacterota bacterium]
MSLVIVESPAKAKTISSFLGKDFEVVACYGHIRDLPKSKLGIDLENNFTPQYIIPVKARKTVNQLKKLRKKNKDIILATDEDREGEAIAFHLTEALDLQKEVTKRIVFHEITKTAIEEALKNPRNINLNLVDAQQARRILDRLVGYKLSPFLWKKIFRGLSAGRVQSPALRLIVEREKERESFKEEKYYTIIASLIKQDLNKKEKNKQTENKAIEAELYKINDKPLPKPGIKSKEEVSKIKKDLEDKNALISNLETKKVQRHSAAPFTTSTLQQSSWQILHFSAKKTMYLAQSLYEGKNLGKGSVGLITYMRTDSINISPVALKAAHNFLKDNFGSEYTLAQPRIFKKRSRLTQEAHEAIRCTDPFYTPEKVKKYLTKDELSLYTLIWARFLASQMPSAILEKTSITTECQTEKNKYLFRNNFYHLDFDGFFRVYPYSKPSNLQEKPNLSLNEEMKVVKITSKEHLTQPPPRYNDASLVKTLESFGIGRPSTYAAIISVLEQRGYVSRDKGKSFIPTEIGTLVNNVLIKHFPNIVDYKFTSKIEEKLDNIAEGKLNWTDTVKEFYEPFATNLEKKYEEVSKEDLAPVVETDEICPKCGSKLVLKLGRFGKFLACSKWPECSFTKPISDNILMKCPQCGKGDIIKKRNKRGQMFYACSRWPECDFASSYKPTGEKCPLCGKPLVETKTKIKCSNRNCNYEKIKKENNSEPE